MKCFRKDSMGTSNAGFSSFAIIVSDVFANPVISRRSDSPPSAMYKESVRSCPVEVAMV